MSAGRLSKYYIPGANDAGVATGNAAFGILLWICGLGAVILAGRGALSFLPKKYAAEEYIIIEDKP